MRKSNWTPSIVPNDHDETVYLVAEDFWRLGRAWRQADYESPDIKLIQDSLSGQYNNPIRIVAFNTAERWSEGISEDVARELSRRCDFTDVRTSRFVTTVCVIGFLCSLPRPRRYRRRHSQGAEPHVCTEPVPRKGRHRFSAK